MIPESLTIAIDLLRHSRRAGGAAGKIVREVLPLLESAEKELRSQRESVRRFSSRSDAGIEYVVEKTAHGEMLTERRLGGKSQPFRCPTRIYRAIIAALAGSASPMAVDEIVAAASRGTERPGDFQVRMVLRLWTHVDPALVMRNRARYQAAIPSAFLRSATDLWKKLRGE